MTVFDFTQMKELKMLHFSRLVFALAQIILFVPRIRGQNECIGHYCHALCNNFTIHPKFNRCIEANVDCDCEELQSEFNPIMYFILILVVCWALMTLWYRCYYKQNRLACGGSGRAEALPVPIVRTTTTEAATSRLNETSYGQSPSYGIVHENIVTNTTPSTSGKQ